MILAKHILLTRKDRTTISYNNITQLYTIGNHIVIVAEETTNIYTTERHVVKDLERMEVEFP